MNITNEGNALAPGQTQSMILCCICGTAIAPNTANMCPSCLATKVDITEGIAKELVVHHCKGRDRYLRPPWTFVKPESKELMALLLRKIRGLKQVRLVDANFIWTEPHSKRIKVKLKVQKEQFSKLVLQQEFAVEYVVANQFCDDCHMTAAGQTWQAVVQVRQKVSHKKTFLFLEQLILKHNAHDATLSIKPLPDGIDFFFATRSHAVRFIDFVGSVMAVRSKCSKQLVSADLKNNDYNYKFNFMVEIVPVCKYDIMALPKPLAMNCGSIRPLVLCDRIGTTIQVVDPLSGQTGEFDEIKYWKHAFRPFAAGAQLVPCTILDVQPCEETGRGNMSNKMNRRIVKVRKRRSADAGLSLRSKKFKMVYVELCRTADLGVVGQDDGRVTVRSHLGHLLKPGDDVLAYDMKNLVYNDADVDSIMGKRGTEPNFPDFVIVRKYYPVRRSKKQNRFWKLQAFRGVSTVMVEGTDEVEGERKKKRRGKDRKARRDRDALARDQMDFESFLQDLEEDPELRSRVNLYKDQKKLEAHLQAKSSAPAGGGNASAGGGAADDDDDDMLEEDFPEIQMDELLESMQGLQASDAKLAENAAPGEPAAAEYDPAAFANGEVTVLAPDYVIMAGAQVVKKK